MGDQVVTSPWEIQQQMGTQEFQPGITGAYDSPLPSQRIRQRCEKRDLPEVIYSGHATVYPCFSVLYLVPQQLPM